MWKDAYCHIMYVKSWEKTPKVLNISEWCHEYWVISRMQHLAHFIKHMFKESLVMCNGEWRRVQDVWTFFQFDHNFVWKEFLYIHRQNTLSFLIWLITE